jgi:hypothetical protein
VAEWIDRMRGVEVAPVAAALGHAVRPSGSSITVSPCPACKAERRHEKRGDKRGAIGIRKRIPGGWRCHVCGVTGDAIHFVALALGGRKFGELDGLERARVRDWCVEYSGGRVLARITPVAIAAAAEPVYVASAELRAVWKACGSVLKDADVAGWLQHERELDPELVDAPKLARALPSRATVPDWACFESGSSYVERGFRFVVPMFDRCGVTRSLVFRRIVEGENGPKSVPPRGFDRVGLVFACPTARHMLRHGTRPVGFENELPVVIAEGEMAFLRWATSHSIPFATLGIVSGSWTPAIAARIPDRSRVVIATDHDSAGATYAAKIIETLAARARAGAITIERWKGAHA